MCQWPCVIHRATCRRACDACAVMRVTQYAHGLPLYKENTSTSPFYPEDTIPPTYQRLVGGRSTFLILESEYAIVLSQAMFSGVSQGGRHRLMFARCARGAPLQSWSACSGLAVRAFASWCALLGFQALSIGKTVTPKFTAVSIHHLARTE